MKCPNCGHWNRDAFPRCFRCGTPLEDENARASWMRASSSSNPRPSIDETLPPGMEYDPGQQTLAAEMQELKRRRAKGEQRLSQLRQDSEAEAEEGYAVGDYAGSVGSVGSTDRTAWTVEEMQPTPQDSYSVEAELVEQPTKKPRRALHITGRVPGTWHRPLRTELPHPDAASALLNQLRERELPEDLDDITDEGFAYFKSEPRLIDMGVPPAESETHAVSMMRTQPMGRTRSRGAFTAAVWLLRIFIAAALAVGAYVAVTVFLLPTLDRQAAATVQYRVNVEDVQGLPGHVIQIPGQEGDKIVIRELAHTYTVINGYATIRLPDYTFYERLGEADLLEETVKVTLTPSLEGSKAMAPIEFDVAVPTSQALLIQPKSTWTQVSTAVGTVQLQVEPGSKVLIGDKEVPGSMNDVSDTMDDSGLLTAQIPVQDKGANEIAILVTAPHARTKELAITFYRAKQEILLTLREDTGVRSVKKENDYEITGYTKPDATVTVDTPHSDLAVDSATGKFTFKALLSMGDNKIVIRASYPGLPDSVLEHQMYYMVPASDYSKKAWALSAKDYQELLTNMEMRVGQIYLCKGRIIRIYSDSPQIAIMDTGSNGAEQLVMLENKSTEVWKLGEAYRVYADVGGRYDTMPSMIGRYTYID
ncbi:hypothetical protein AGMMS49992_14930 [Clostridia bacterium]|nr:hypothetical protein AGMMS49992_14930 [Clostridia bacterium]